MRGGLFMALLLACGLVGQETDSSAVMEAKQHAERVRALVEAGAAPRRELERAEQALAEARDKATLGATLYSAAPLGDMKSGQIDEMVAAAERMVARHEEQLSSTQSAVDQGALPRNSLQPEQDEMRERLETLELARERAGLFHALEAAVLAERELMLAMEDDQEPAADMAIVQPFGEFRPLHMLNIEGAFKDEFGQALPISAYGATTLHRSLGFDHRGRVDVALHPDQPQGRWLRGLLEEMNVPYIAYRTRVAGKSTGAHIHIGPPSPRVGTSH